MSVWQSETEYTQSQNYIQIPKIWFTEDSTIFNNHIWYSEKI